MLATVSLGAQAQASLTTSPYTQSFDGLANTGASNAKSTLPTGWDFTETGTSALADNLYATDNGAGNGGNTYSYGATGGTDRALGSLRSGTLAVVLGARFANNTGAALPSLALTYTGETWRVGGTARADKMTFEYSTDATSLSTGTWTAVTALDYTNNSATATTTAGVSTPVQTTAVTGTIASLNLVTGATIWFRWTDTDASGADDGMAIDDISLSWGTTNPTGATLTASVTALTFGGQNVGTTSAAQTYTLSGTSLTGATTLTATGPFTISKTSGGTFGTTLNYAAADLATAQTVYVQFTPTATGTATGSIANASTGATTRTVALTGTGVDPTQTSFDFNTCATTLSDGWLQYSVTGPQVWGCTTFGRDPAAPAGTVAAPYGVQINGYAGGNIANEDWFISPSFNLTNTTFPLFSFWSRTAFSGPGLKLLVSTNYSGSGAPSAATWTDLNAQFPGAGSDVWTQTAGINLSAYKSAKVYVAFVYTSTTTGAARWTLDDIALTNSTTAPAPSFFTDVNSLAFGYQAVGTTGTRTLNVTGANLTGGVTLTSSNAAFTLSKDGTTFASTVALTQAEANGVVKPVTVRFSPTVASTNYSATLTLTSAGATSRTVAVTGNTYDVAKTLEVVNWNMEWFGSPDATLGPADKNLQYTNAFTVLSALKADVYALEEVVDTVRLRTLVTQLSTANGVTYAYKISEFGSYADDKNDPDYITAQKLAFIYRTDMVANPSFRGLLRCSQAAACPAFTPWASGRFPYSMRADVTVDGVTKKVNFVVIHAKANATATSANDYARRKAGADLLKAELEATYPTDNTLIVGDYNDVLEGTIATGVTPAISSYSAFTQDANYLQITLPLAQAGGRSTAGFPTVIDNVIANKNMAQYYIAGTAAIRTDVTTGITNYANTTSDHYPIFSRYSFTGVALATKGARTASLGLYPNPVINSVRFDVPETGKDLSLSVYTTTGSLVLRGTGTVEQLNQQLSQRVAGLAAGLYVVRVVGAQQTYTDRFQKQ
ncbi:hypothetical protein GCM10027422_11570 [Hymenobacter arcticus]